MTDSVALPGRRPRGSSFADRLVGVPTLGMLAFGVSVGVLLCVLALGRIGALDDSRRDLYENSMVAFSDLDAIQSSYEAIRQGYTAYTRADVATRAALKDELAGARAALEEQMDAYAGGTEHADRFSTLTDDIAAYFAISDGQLVAALDAGDTTTAGAVAAGPLVPVQNAVTKDFSGLRTALRDGADVQARAGADDASAATALLWAILGLSVGIGFVLALVVARQIVRTAGPVRRSVDALISGVDPAGAGTARPDELSASTAQVASSAEVTSPQTGVVPSAVELVSRDVETAVTAAGRRMRPHVREPDSAAVARQGDGSAEIGDVIKVVRSIVRQTDLLALNATIEAARAGEASKGSRVGAGGISAAVAACDEVSTVVAQTPDRPTPVAATGGSTHLRRRPVPDGCRPGRRRRPVHLLSDHPSDLAGATPVTGAPVHQESDQ